MIPIQRARRPEQKEVRRQAILDAALSLWLEEGAQGEFTMSRLAEHTGLAKGTLYLYFATQEDLFLTLLEEMLGSWFDEVAHKLRPMAGCGDPRRVARLLSRTLSRRNPLTGLFRLLRSVLEPGLNAQSALGFKERVCAKGTEASDALERALPDLPVGDGHRVIVHTLALVTGLRQIYENEQTLQRIIPEKTEIPCVHPRFEQELEVGLLALLRGFLAE
jgi:AcrR family transcriptional regulator